jgi:hypothetical protein
MTSDFPANWVWITAFLSVLLFAVMVAMVVIHFLDRRRAKVRGFEVAPPKPPDQPSTQQPPG